MLMPSHSKHIQKMTTLYQETLGIVEWTSITSHTPKYYTAQIAALVYARPQYVSGWLTTLMGMYNKEKRAPTSQLVWEYKRHLQQLH
jgi:hypothetical protein